jgi:3D (Asp-Asp-Asp) domain-containing protein
MSQGSDRFVGVGERRSFMKNTIATAGLMALGLFTITVHENQVEIIKQQEAHINSLETNLEERDQYVSELNKTTEKLSVQLSQANKKVEELEKENKELQDRLDSFIKLEATAYTPFCDTGCQGVTASGHNVANTKTIDGKRVVAVDPNLIPLGTVMEVHTADQSFEAIALDTGGDIQGHRLDVLFLAKSKANKFGRQDVYVEIKGHIEDFRSL